MCLPLAGALAIMSASPVLAQGAPAASRVAPQSLAPQKPDVSSAIALPGQPTADAPPGADALLVTVAGVEVSGDLGHAPARVVAAIAEAKQAIAGHSVTVSSIYDAAARIEAAYASAGLVLTRVTLPPQRIVDGGTVRLLVVDGFIESVDVAGVPTRVRAAVRRRVAGLIGAHDLTLAQIERRVLLAGEVPGVHLSSALVPGKAPGATTLVIEGSYRPVTAIVSADNGQDAAYLHEALSAQLVLNSILGLGEEIYAQGTSGPDLGRLFSNQSRRRILGAGVIAPIGGDGLTANIEYTRVDTLPRTPAGDLVIGGRYRRLALRAAYPLIESRRQTLTMTGSFELSSESQTAKAFDVELNKDRLRVLVVAMDYSRALTSRLGLSANARVDAGLAGLGARTQNDATASGIPLSRQGSRPDFRKVSGTLSLADQLGAGFAVSSATTWQLSLSRALPSSAQISLDNGDGLTSFTQGANNVDSGVAERVEVTRDIAFVPAARGMLTPYVFGAVGHGDLGDPTAVEAADVTASSFGAGLRLLLRPAGKRLTGVGSIEVSHGHSTIVDKNPTRISASFSLRL